MVSTVMTEPALHPSMDPHRGDQAGHAAFRRVMASFITGVTVITTRVSDEIRGMTANAFMSGSLEPPLCVISVGLKARMHAALMESGHFGVNILAKGQEPLIGHFAGKPVEGLKVNFDFAGDTPLIANSHAMIAARTAMRYDCGDHSLFIGHIFALRQPDHQLPLVLHAGRLAGLQQDAHRLPSEPSLDFW